MTTETETPPIDTLAAFGRVVNIRTVPSRGVTQIVIELPDEFHVMATSMLYNKDAFIFAATPGAKVVYGVSPLGSGLANAEQPATQEKPGAEHTRTTTRHGGLTHAVNPTQWLAVKCGTVQFMDWLQVSSTADAVDKVREMCGVESRKDIAGNPMAMNRFMDRIYHPFNRHIQAAERQVQIASNA
jgi:hypothetical protein